MIEFNNDLYFLLHVQHKIDSQIRIIKFDKKKKKFTKSKKVFYGAYPSLHTNGRFLYIIFNQKSESDFLISLKKFDNDLNYLDSTILYKKPFDSYTSGEYQSIVDLHQKTNLIFIDWSDKSWLKSMDISGYFHQN